ILGESPQCKGAEEANDGAEKLHHHKGRGIHVSGVTGKHELAFLLLEIANRGETLQESRDLQDDWTNSALSQRFSEFLVTCRLHRLTAAVEGKSLRHVLTGASHAHADPDGDKQDQCEN